MTQHSDPLPAPAAFPEPDLDAGNGYQTYEGYDGYEDEPYDERPGPRPLRRVFTWILWILALPVLTIVGARLLPDDGITPVAQLVPFFPYAAACAVPLVVLAVTGRRHVLSLLLVAAVTAGGYLAGSGFIPTGQQAQGANHAEPGTLRLMSVNASYGRADAVWVTETVRAEGVEVLAVQELTPEFADALTAAGLDELLPYAVTGKLATGSAAGSGLYSSLELTDENGGESTTFAMPSAVVDAGGQDVRIRCVHPVPPMPGSTGLWQQELRELGLTARTDATAQILMGDFNASWDHASFRNLLGDRFHDAWRDTGAGLERTWPEGATVPVTGTAVPALVAIDHVVVDDGMRVGDIRSRIIPGSDHRVVLSTVVVR